MGVKRVLLAPGSLSASSLSLDLDAHGRSGCSFIPVTVPATSM